MMLLLLSKLQKKIADYLYCRLENIQLSISYTCFNLMKNGLITPYLQSWIYQICPVQIEQIAEKTSTHRYHA